MKEKESARFFFVYILYFPIQFNDLSMNLESYYLLTDKILGLTIKRMLLTS